MIFFLQYQNLLIINHGNNSQTLLGDSIIKQNQYNKIIICIF